MAQALNFDGWKFALLNSAGSASPAVLRLGDYVLELFWRDGCEPTVSALLHYAESGLLSDSESYAARGVLTPRVPLNSQL